MKDLIDKENLKGKKNKPKFPLILKELVKKKL